MTRVKSLNYKPNRRSFIRVPVPSPFRVEVGPPLASSGERLDCRGIDLSVYGMSFAMSAEQARPVSVGTIFENLRFFVGQRRISVDARVTYLEPVPSRASSLQKLGVEFLNIPQDDVWFLSSFIVKAADLAPSRARGPRLPKRAKGPSLRKAKKHTKTKKKTKKTPVKKTSAKKRRAKKKKPPRRRR